MTTNLQPLYALLAQSERQRDMALAEQQKAQSASNAAKVRADQLLEYRREYEQRWSAQFTREGQIELVRCYQGFIERLTQAVEHQARLATIAVEQLALATSKVQEQELRVAAVKRLVGRRVVEGQNIEHRQEQKQSDELAARVAWNAKAAAGRANIG